MPHSALKGALMNAPLDPQCLPSSHLTSSQAYTPGLWLIVKCKRISGAPLSALAPDPSRVDYLSGPHITQTLPARSNGHARHPLCGEQMRHSGWRPALLLCHYDPTCNAVSHPRASKPGQMNFSLMSTGMCIRKEHRRRCSPTEVGSLLLVTVGKTGKRIDHHKIVMKRLPLT